jgi:hypothetical protein
LDGDLIGGHHVWVREEGRGGEDIACRIEIERHGFHDLLKHEELQAHSFPIEIKFEEVPSLTGDKLTAKLQKLAEAVGEHMMKTLLAKHEEATEMTGNRIDAMGRPMNGAMLFTPYPTCSYRIDRPSCCV